MRKKNSGHKGYVGMKLDIAKAYDGVEQNFQLEVPNSLGFPTKRVELVKICISTSSFLILLNGIPCKQFKPFRRLRQVDLLSPYLFILCVEVFSGLLIHT